MFTIFATAKPFTGHFGVIQSNAIRSWRTISPDIDIILFGDSPGSAEIAGEVGARYIPEILCNERGTPYLNDLFRRAEALSPHTMLCYINADIILPANFIEAVHAVSHLRRFLLVGSRWDVDWPHPLDFASPEAVAQFEAHIQEHAVQHPPSGIDYFLFSKGLWKNLPPFLAGRAGFDNWLIWKARRQRNPVIDASDMLRVVHQNHDYSHHPQGRDGVFVGDEAQHNRELHQEQTLNILDATWRLTPSGLSKKRLPDDRSRYLNRLPRVYPEIAGALRLAIKVYRRLFLTR